MTITSRGFAELLAARLTGKQPSPTPQPQALAAPVSFTEFKRRVWPGYIHADHLEAIDWHLGQVSEFLTTGGESGIDRLMIFTPPRHGKSTTISQYFPAYMLGSMPETQIIMTSYGDRLARRNSRRVRNTLNLPSYQAIFPRTYVDPTKSAANDWDTTAGGKVISSGVGGGIAGYGANLIIIDDPVKSRVEAESEAYRERTKEWYTSDLYTRQNTPCAIVLMMTRWHYDDLGGWLLGDDADKWTVLSLPAIAGENDPLGREVGAALWPELYPLARLNRFKEQMGEYDFAALFQQTPLSERGALFDTTRLEVTDTPPECAEMVRFWDLAVTTKTRSSYTAGVLVGVGKVDDKVVVHHVWRGQREAPDIHEAIVQTAQLDGPKVKIRLEAEKAGIVELQHLLRDKRMRGFTMDARPPQGDKYTRAGPIAARVNAGHVVLMRGGWNRAFIDELSTFPAGGHDDQVDALSGAWAMLAKPVRAVSSVKATGLYQNRQVNRRR